MASLWPMGHYNSCGQQVVTSVITMISSSQQSEESESFTLNTDTQNNVCLARDRHNFGNPLHFGNPIQGKSLYWKDRPAHTVVAHQSPHCEECGPDLEIGSAPTASKTRLRGEHKLQ